MSGKSENRAENTVMNNRNLNYLTICHLNVRSLRNKLEEFEVLLESLDYPEIICISEINYNESEILTLKLLNYKLTDFFCRSSYKLGGVAIFINNQVNFKIKTCSVNKIEKLFEYALIELLLEGCYITVGCFYRSPSSKTMDAEYFISNMDALLNTIYKSTSPTFICGDFNFNFDDNVQDTYAKKLCSTLGCYGLIKCITEFTRIQGDSKTIIDNIFSNVSIQCLNPKVIHTDLSDHFMQSISYCCKLNDNEVKCSYHLKRFFNNAEHLNYFKYLLSQEKWYFNENDGCEHNFNKFYKTFLKLMDAAFPLEYCKIKRRQKRRAPWINIDIINEGIFLRDLHQSYKFSGDNEVLLRYKIIKKNHRDKIEQAKRTYNEIKYINSSNKSKAAWQIINKKRDNIQLPKQFVDQEGNNVDNMSRAADAFNNFFINSVKTLTDNMSPSNDDKQIFNNRSIFLRPYNANELLDIIKSVSTKNSSGEDEIPCSLLIKVAEFIAEPLASLVNLSFTDGVFPASLKNALVLPIHKKNDKSIISNYRGIALLSAFSKTLEKSYYIRLNEFIIKQNLLSERQFGFRKGLATKDAVLSLYNYILDNFENRSKTACLFFDLTRAFDTVDHNLLLNKLFNYGIRGPALSWIKSYLSGRTQSVVIKDVVKTHKSSPLNVSTGVPQGSILGPLLFLIFINNITQHMTDVVITLFADDSTMAVDSSSINELSFKASRLAKTMQNYCATSGLFLNNSKTDLLVFSTTKLDYSLLVKMDNSCVKLNNTVKFLGVYMDPLLKWGAHIDYVVGKLATHCFVIWQLRRSVTLHILKMYYFSHIQSCLNYCNICWGNCSRSSEVFTLQKKIVRTMLFKPPRYSCKSFFIELGILTVPCLYILNCVLYIREHPDQFKGRISPNGINLRPNYNLNIPGHTLSSVAKGPKLMAIKLFNKLPTQIKMINVVQLFKKEVKSLLLKNAFYSVEEYLSTNLNIQ